jgi:hypothetical protein
LYNSSINIGVTANKNMFSNNVQTLSSSTNKKQNSNCGGHPSRY